MNSPSEKQTRLQEIWPEVAKNTRYREHVARWTAAVKATNDAAFEWAKKREQWIERGLSQDYLSEKAKWDEKLQRLYDEQNARLEELMALEEKIIEHLRTHGAL